MIVTVLRCIIIYIIALIVIRVMGKRQIAQMQPFDVVITLIIADLATIPMSDQSIPLLNGIIPLLVLTVLHFLTTFLSTKNLRFRKLVNGRPIIIVSPAGIREDNIKKLNMTVADVMETIRYAGYLSLENISYVIMETNGNISIIPTNNASSITREDLKIKRRDEKLPVVLISDGKISKENLKLTKVNEKELKLFLNRNGTDYKDIIIMHYASDGTIYLQSRTKGKKMFNQILTK